MAENQDGIDVTVELGMRWWVAPLVSGLGLYIRLADGLLWPFLDEDAIDNIAVDAVMATERLVERHGVKATVVGVKL